MATFDYGASGDTVDLQADYQWQGLHAFEYEVYLSADVDLGDASMALRAVNAGSVAQYVQQQIQQSGGGSGGAAIPPYGYDWEIYANAVFLGERRAYFQQNPYLGEAVSLWDIGDLLTWPDPVQLETPVRLGDAKDYIDHNLSMAVDYVLGEIAPAVGAELGVRLPAAVDAAMAEQFTSRSDQYAAEVLYPEIDRRIGVAFEGTSGGTSEAVAEEVNAQLTPAIEAYSESTIYPTVVMLAGQAAQSELTGLSDRLTLAEAALPATEERITLAYTQAIGEALAGYVPPDTGDGTGGTTWTQAELEALAETVVDQRVPPLLAAQVPPAVAAEVTAQLDAKLPEGLEAALLAALPEAVNAEVTGQLGTAVTNEVASQLSATLEQAINSQLLTQLETAIPDAVGAQLSQQLTTEALWPLVADNALTQTRQEIATALEGVTAQLPQEPVADLIAAELGVQLPIAIDTALPGALAAELPSAVIPHVDAALAERLPDGSIDTIVNEALTAQLPTAVAPIVDEALTGTVPGMVDQAVATALEAALGSTLAEGGTLDAAIDASTQEAVARYYTESIEPGLDALVTETVTATVPAIVTQEVEAAIGSASLTEAVQQEVQNALQPELDQLISTTVPNVVNVQLTETLPGLVDERLSERYGDERIPAFRRFDVVQASSLWVIEHNMGTTTFNARLYNSEGVAMFAHVEPVDETSLVVRLTTAMTGWVDVEFFL